MDDAELVKLFFFAVGTLLLVIGVVNRLRREKKATWFLVSGAVSYLLGALILSA
jgi:uncharacterized membrane protein HdeD (DUF308 family)